NLLARRLDPVSVSSTMASTRPVATFASVAPQENSTSALTLCLAKYFLVTLTTSVAIFLPCRSLTDLIEEASGTANTQRTLLLVCLAYNSSAKEVTSEEFSSIQSAP